MRFLASFPLLPLLAKGTPLVNVDDYSQDSTDNVNIATLVEFDIAAMNEPDFKPRSLDPASVLKRSTDSALACRGITPVPQTGGKWLFRQATCLYPFSPSSRFTADCQAETKPDELRPNISGDCNTKDADGKLVRRVCFQNHAYNEVGDPAFDIFCADPKSSLKWAINDGDNHVCSKEWTNLGTKPAQVEIIVNVLDSTQSYSVEPGDVWFQVNGLKTGTEKGLDAFVNSGKITISPGIGAIACVAPQSGQILNAFGTLKSLKWLG